MRREVFAFVVLLLTISVNAGAQFATRWRTLHFEQHTDGKSSVQTPKNLPVKAKRASSKEGRAKITYDKSVPDSVKSSIEMAAKIWTTRIQNRRTIHILAKWDSCPDDVAFTTEVQYQDVGNVSKPMALLSQLKNEQVSYEGNYDVVITYNSSKRWNCSFDAGCSSEGLNMLTQSLRAIATGLGFGTSIYRNTKNSMLAFRNDCPTVYDSYLWSNGVRLSTVPSGGELERFLRGKDFAFVGNDHTYKVYSPGWFIENKTHIFLDDTDCLMHYDWGPDVKWMDVDEISIDVLRSIGWKFESDELLKIVSDELGESGVGSAYQSHSFRIETNGKEISSPKWSFYLTTKVGKEELIKSGTGNTFEIPAIQSPDKYRININGDLEGTVEFNCTCDGKDIGARPYHISLGVKPTIISVENIERIPMDNSDDNYRLSFDIHYRGSDHVSVVVEEDGNTFLQTVLIYEPVYAHALSSGICRIFNSWVHIKATNEYGKATYTIELPAESPNQIRESRTSHSISDKRDVCSVYSLGGQNIVKGCTRKEAVSGLPNGLYILETESPEGNIKREKIYVK